MAVTLQEVGKPRKRKVLHDAIKKSQLFPAGNLVQVRANRLAVPRQVHQYGIV
jgi:hypothetical protein